MLVISPKKKYGFTLAELLSSLLIISLLAVLLFPSFKWMTGHANSARCIANMRTIYSAMAAYTNDGGYWPSVNVNSETDPAASGSQLWYVALVRLGYLPSKKEKRDNRDVLIAKALICPSNKDDPGEPYIYTSSPYPWRSNYAMNFYWGERADASIWSPRVPALGMSYSSAILLIDSKSKAGSIYPNWNVQWSSKDCAIPKIHNGGAHALLGNGAVITVTPQSHPDIENPKYWNPRP